MTLKEHLTWRRVSLFVLFVLVLGTVSWPSSRDAIRDQIQSTTTKDDQDIESWCPLPDKVPTPNDGLRDSAVIFDNDAALKLQVERLSAAVNISTVSYDDAGDVDFDTRWQIFAEHHNVLERLFPLTHEKLKLEKVNKYGLLYHLPGSKTSLKPLLFMAHQDVVPAASLSSWKHPPFQAHFDGKWLWGRGAADCKSNLIGLLSALEALLYQGFEPARTIIFSFGFDEEIGGYKGADKLSRHIEREMGTDSLAMILDEGGMGVSRLGHVAYALPAIAEKGFVDVVMTLEVHGGHASRPPTHSGIGIMSQIVVALEEHQFTPVLDHVNPVRGVLECEARHSPKHVEPWLRRKLKAGGDLGPQIAYSRNGNVRWQIQTSQAVDVIRGGEKDNALPEEVEVIVNYRIAPHENVDQLLHGVAKAVKGVAHKHNISTMGFGFDEPRSVEGILKLKSKDLLLPSPITPASAESSLWRMLAGTIRTVFESASTLYDVRKVVPVGSIATGNSDTAHYWNLTRNIFRFTPAREGSRQGVHTINERMSMSAHLEGARVYYDTMRNFQTYEGDSCDGPCPSL